MSGRFSIDAVFKGIDGMTATIRRISGRLRALGDSDTFKKMNTQAGQFLTGLRNVGLAAIAAGTAIAGIGANVVGVGMEFEATLMGAVARFPGEIRRGTAAFDQLQAAAERLGATTEFDAQQAASALQAYAASGFSATLAISSLTGAGDLATVSGLALDDAAKTAADSLGALGLRSADAGQQAINLTRLNDRLARATGLANTSVTELAEGIKVGGNMAIQSGQSFETFTALMASMAGANIKGAEAGTAIRNMFSSLQAPSSRAADALRRLHIRVADGDGNMRDMVDIMGDLATATAGMGEVQRNADLNHIFGDAAMPAALALLNTGADGLRRLRTELNNSDGAAARMAATMRDTTKNEIDGFLSAIDGVKTALFNVASGPFREFLAKMTQWIGLNTQAMASRMNTWMQEFAANIDTIARRAQGLAVLVTGLAAIALGIKAVAAATAIWNALAAANPWMLAIMGIIVVVSALVAYRTEVAAFFERFTIVRRIAMFITGLAAGIATVVLGIKAIALATLAWNAVLAMNPAVFIFMAIIAAIVLLDAYWPQIAAYFTQLWADLQEIGAFIGEMFSALWDRIVFGWGEVKEAFVLIGSQIGAWFAGLWAGVVAMASNAWNGIKNAASGAWNGIVSAATGMYTSITSVFEPLVAWFSGIWSRIASSFTSVVGPIIDTAMRIVSALTGGAVGGGAESGGGGAPQPSPQVVSPQQRTAQAVNSTSTNTTTAEVRVRAEPGTNARVTRQPARGTPVRVQRSAA